MRILRASFTILGLLLAIIRPAGAAPTSFLWVADSEGALKLSAQDGTQLLTISDVQQAKALAVDPGRGTLWLYAQRTLVAYDLAGNRQVAQPLPLQDVDRISLVVNQNDGSAWLGAGRSLRNFSSAAQLLGSQQLAADIRRLAVDPSRGILWIAASDSAGAYDLVSGSLIRELDLGTDADVRDLALDASSGTVWIARAGSVSRFDATGTLLGLTPVKSAAHIAVDGQGGAYFTVDKTVKRVSPSGQLLFSLKLAALRELPVALAANPVDSSLWVATPGELALLDGAGTLLHLLEEPAAIRIHDIQISAAAQPPTLTFLSPAASAYINTQYPELELAYTSSLGIDPNSVVIQQAGATLASACQVAGGTATCTLLQPLPEGTHALSATIADVAGVVSAAATVSFTVDTVSPVIVVTQPLNGTLTNQAQQTFIGSVSEPATLAVNGQSVTVAPDLTFNSGPVSLPEGTDTVYLVATDRAGNIGLVTVTLTVDTTPPAPASAMTITVTLLAHGVISVTAAAASAELGSSVTITNLRTAQTVHRAAGADGGFALNLAGQGGDVLAIVVTDAAGNNSSPTSVTVPGIPPGQPLPPDPATVAPAIDPSVATDIAAATTFIYSGADPIQPGVAPGAIDARYVAVIRGRVLGRDGTPLPAATITVLGHPELGSTVSRADGGFDLAVNGGGVLTLKYDNPSYLPVQRQLSVPWRDFMQAPDVVLLPADSQVTAVTSGAGAFQIARGSTVQDDSGTRRSTLLFPPGTQAQLLLADGTQQPLATLSVRATEYTVGANGPASMPADLPPTTGYTYAVELGADEAAATGAKSITFNQPVLHYVENFLGFPIGGLVPAGYYDRTLGAWLASDNGRVIQVLDVVGGLAELDVSGSGSPASPEDLAALGITDAERQQLASLYPAGQGLWRVPISHFTPFDFNWSFKPPFDATPPSQPAPIADQPDDKPCAQPGSVIECQNETLGESIPVAGTPFSLVYRSNRVPGWAASYTTRIWLSGPTVPASLLRIELEVSVAGRLFSQTFSNAPNQSYVFTWDGKDIYGRPFAGRQPAIVTIGYVYPGAYETPAPFALAWSWSSAVPFAANPSRLEFTLLQQSRVLLGSWSVPPLELGGWRLSAHHYYDAIGQVLFLGTGEKIAAVPVNRAVNIVAGVVQQEGFNGDGGLATAANLSAPQGLALAPDGSLYIADTISGRVRKVTPDGIIHTVAGGVNTCNAAGCGDGGPATQAGLTGPYAVAAGPDGSLYISDTSGIRKVDGNGIISTVYKDFAYGLDVDSQGSLYIASNARSLILRIDPRGNVTTVAGTGTPGFSGDGGPALAANIDHPFTVKVDKQGNVYFVDYFNSRIRKVTPGGIISTVAGNGVGDSTGDGGAATLASLNGPHGIALTADGSLYISEWLGERVRRVTPDGLISTVAGTGVAGETGDGGLATEARFSSPLDVAVSPAGALFVLDSGNDVVRKVDSPLPGFGQSFVLIASADGRQVYQFDALGRHLQTLDSLTGATLFQFSYDGTGNLISVQDRNGLITNVERDGSGTATALVAPFGERTILALDGNGYLASVTSPAGHKLQFTYGSGGLLSSFVDANQGTAIFQYDAVGRLTVDQDAAGGSKILARSDTASGFRVDLTSGGGLATSYAVDQLPSGAQRWTTTLQTGLQQVSTLDLSGSLATTLPDGTVLTEVLAPDPRFGQQAFFAGSETVKLPSGLTSSLTRNRIVTLADPINLLSLQTALETVSLNGHTYTRLFDKGSRTFTFTSAAGRQELASVDALGRIVSDQFGGFAPLSVTYDASGRPSALVQGSGSDRRIVTFGYGADGLIQSITDPVSRVTQLQRDADGRILQLSRSPSQTTTEAYDGVGNLTSLTAPGGGVSNFAFTPVNLLRSYTPPALGAGGGATTFTYDLDHKLLAIGRPDGQTVGLGYDGSGRLTTISLPGGDQVGYGYDGTTGHLLSATAPSGVNIAFAFDGYLPIQSTWSGPIAGSVTVSHDSDFNVISTQVDGANPIAAQFDADDLLVQAGDEVVTRDPQSGVVTGTSLGQVTTQQGYSTFGEMTSFSASAGSSALIAEQYVRDQLGRITRKVETLSGIVDTYDYVYDAAGRLAAVQKDGVPLAQYTFDANGNRTAVTSGSGTVSATYGAQDRLTQYGDLTYAYTANGELESKSQNGATVGYTYDALGNLTAATLADGRLLEYVIDAQNRRVGTIINGAVVSGFLYHGTSQVVAQLDGAGNVVSRFVYGTSRGVPDYMLNGGAAYRILCDPQGSPRLVVNTATGEIAERIDYDVFGQVILDTSPGFQPFGFAGGLYDPQTGLVRLGARDYDPQVGRWTAKDPTLFGGGNTNLYGYGFNDPLNVRDREGKIAVPIVVVGGVLLVVTAAVLAWELWLQTPPGQDWLHNLPQPTPIVDPILFPRPWNPPGAPGRRCPAPTAIPGARPRTTPPPALTPADPEDNEPPDLEPDNEKKTLWDNIGDLLDSLGHLLGG